MFSGRLAVHNGLQCPFNYSIRPIVQSLSQLVVWISRAWPVLAMVPLASAHALAHSLFPTDPTLVNKVTGTALQTTGGLLVLYAINANLGLFRNQHLGDLIIGGLRSFPLFRKPVTLIAAGCAQANASGSGPVSSRRVPTTVDERIAELERQLDEFRTQVNEDLRAATARIDQVHSELSAAAASDAAALSQLSTRLEEATVGGVKQQAFGVMLALYGAVANVFA